MTDQEDTETYANTSATSSPADTELAQPSSPDVLAMANRDLIVRRNKVGAESREGRLLSTLIQQIRNYRKETDPTARVHLKWGMNWTRKLLGELPK